MRFRKATGSIDLLHVVTDTARRGAQIHTVDLHRALERKGRQVRTVALAPGQDTNRLDLPTLGPARIHVVTLRTLRQEMRRADVTVGFGSTTLPACAAAGWARAASLSTSASER